MPETPALPVTLDREAATPLAVQLAEQLRAAAGDGRLRSGDRLPSTRALATELEVSRTVTAAAYEQLHAEGWIAGRHGSGTYVTTEPPGSLRPPTKPVRRDTAADTALDLTPGSPWAGGIDTAAWRRAWRAAAHVAPMVRPNRAGLSSYRTTVAEHLLRHRGLARRHTVRTGRSRGGARHVRHVHRGRRARRRGAPPRRRRGRRGAGLPARGRLVARGRPAGRAGPGRRGRPADRLGAGRCQGGLLLARPPVPARRPDDRGAPGGAGRAGPGTRLARHRGRLRRRAALRRGAAAAARRARAGRRRAPRHDEQDPHPDPGRRLDGRAAVGRRRDPGAPRPHRQRPGAGRPAGRRRVRPRRRPRPAPAPAAPRAVRAALARGRRAGARRRPGARRRGGRARRGAGRRTAEAERELVRRALGRGLLLDGLARHHVGRARWFGIALGYAACSREELREALPVLVELVRTGS